MGMQIDKPRRHVLAARVDDAKGRLRRDIRLDRGDAVALNRNIQTTAVPAAGVNHFATFDQKIESHRITFYVFSTPVDSAA